MDNRRVREAFLQDVLAMAAAGAIEAWGRIVNLRTDRQGNVFGFQVLGDPQLVTGRRIVAPATVELGMREILQPGFKVSGATRARVQRAFTTGDASVLFEDEVDAIIQAALFGRIVYDAE